MEFINIGPLGGGVWGGVSGGKAKTKKQDDTLVEFRVAMISTYTHKGPIFHYNQGLDRHVTVGVISGPHCQIGALYWCHFTSRGFTWLEKSTLEKQTS